MRPFLLSALLLAAASQLHADSVAVSDTTAAVSATAAPVSSGSASPLLAPATPLEWSARFADSQIQRDGDKLMVAPAGKGWWDYTTGLYEDALIRLSGATGNPAYEKNAEQVIGSFITTDGTILTYEKRRPLPRPSPGQGSPTPTPDQGLPQVKVPYSLDDVESGVATLELYDLTHDEKYHKAADILRHQLSVHPRIPEGGFWHKAIYPNQMWLDGLYMGEPFYASYAVHFNEPKDFDDIAKQFTIIAAHTYDPATGLFYHGWDESMTQNWANKKTGTSASFWGRAIGWYAMALVDVLEIMPKDHPARPALLDLVQKVAGGLLKNQDQKTGVWWQVTDQPGRERNYLESSSSSMFVYFLAKAVNLGYLPKSDIPAIRAGYQGIIRQFISIDKDGNGIDVTHICKVATLGKRGDGSYEYYTEKEPMVSNDQKGTGPFIMAGIEVQKLLGPETFSQ